MLSFALQVTARLFHARPSTIEMPAVEPRQFINTIARSFICQGATAFNKHSISITVNRSLVITLTREAFFALIDNRTGL